MKRFLLASLLLPIVGLSQSKWYVDASNTATQNGTSWATAFMDVQPAIDAASAGDSVFVKKGAYKPTQIQGTGSDPRDKAFRTKNGVKVYGGFAGTEASLSQRLADSLSLHVTNNTILSGDLGVQNDISDNAYHVVMSISSTFSAVLDGFEISGGNADTNTTNTVNGTAHYRDVGAGVYTTFATATFSNCVLKGNFAKRGGAGMNNTAGGPVVGNCVFKSNLITGTYNQNPNGGGAGMRNDGSSPTISDSYFEQNESYTNQGGGGMRNENNSNPVLTNVVFYDNYTEDGDGGAGMYNASGSGPTLTNVSFIENNTLNQGGAIYNDSSIPIATNCLFKDNFGEGGAGAIECDALSNMQLTSCEFIDNSTWGDGGAIQCWKSSPVIEGCTFEGNHADGDGGGILNYNECSPWIANSIFKNNTCDGNGGAIYNRRDCHPILTQLLIYGNYAGINGGGVYTVSSNGLPCSPIATNVTITKNEASNSGGGAYDDALGNSRLRNSIISGNTALTNAEVDAPAASAVTNLFYSIIGTDYFTFGANPPTTVSSTIFVNPANNDFHLASGSPALSVGDSSFYATSATPDLSDFTVDLDSNDRIMGANIDLGPYEVCVDTVSPVVQIAVSPSDSVLDSTMITFSSTLTNGGSAPTYQWKKNGVDIAGATSGTYVAMAGVDVLDGDVISLMVISNAFCLLNNVGMSEGLEMTVYQECIDTTNREVHISVSPSDTIADWEVAVFTSSLVNPGQNLVYQWLKNGNAIIGQTAPTCTLSANSDIYFGDIVSLKLIYVNMCGTDSIISSGILMKVYVTPGFNELYEYGFSIYPNPITRGSVLQINTENNELSRFMIHDMQGRLVWRENLIGNTLEIPIDLDCGSYTITIESEGTRSVKKLLVTGH